MAESRPFITENNAYYDEESLVIVLARLCKAFNPQVEIEDPKLARRIRHGFIKKVYGIIASQLFLSVITGVGHPSRLDDICS